MIIVPVSICYDKIYDGNAIPNVLLGEKVQGPSLLASIKNMVFTKEDFGKVYIKYGEPISLKEKINSFF